MKLLHKFILTIWIQLITACVPNSNKIDNQTEIIDSDSIHQTVSKDLYTILSSEMHNTVNLDTFLTQITHQENVKVLSTLKEEWDHETKIFIYSDSIYIFKLKIEGHPYSNLQESNSIFIDANTKISFENYNVTCYSDSIFRCENYGFNERNILKNARIIEVCGKHFLYADISYECNGIGCGIFITFIYDIQTHKPTFIENYRIPYEGFFVSDFDNNNIPDLLVISQTLANKMKGFELDEFEIKLLVYSYKNGTFELNIDKQYLRPYCYRLYSFTDQYNHSYHDNLIYAITDDNWFRK